MDVSWTQRQEEVLGENQLSTGCHILIHPSNHDQVAISKSDLILSWSTTDGSGPSGSLLQTREVDSDVERELDSRSSYCFSSQTSSFPHLFSFSPQFPTKLFTRLKSLCLSVTEHALSSDNWSAQKKKWAGKHFLMWRNSFDVSCAECPSLVSVSLVDPYCNSFLVHTSGNTLLHAEILSFVSCIVSEREETLWNEDPVFGFDSHCCFLVKKDGNWLLHLVLYQSVQMSIILSMPTQLVSE